MRKFFPNIDQTLLYERLQNLIRCPEVLALIRKILGSYNTTDLAPPYFEGDDLFAVTRPRGLPIGNLTSQLWGNFVLDGLDHRIVEGERHGAYLRYTDDFLLFGDEKERLWELREVVIEELRRVRLRLAEPKSRMMAVSEGIPFCGFRFFSGVRPRVLGATKRRFEARRRALPKVTGGVARLSEAVFAWYQFSREGNTLGLRRAYARRRC